MQIIGHQKQLNYLKKITESAKIPQALLFSGEARLGKKTIALEFISRLFEEPDISKILNHPDFILIEPQGKHPEAERSSLRGSPVPSSALVRGQIQIDQIRDLSWRLSLKPIKAQLKAAIIDESHSMTGEAQNCFLKTLEEPKGNTLLILITDKPNFLLPTIISRCQIIKFYPVKKDEIRSYLKNQEGLSKGEIEEILEISQGRPGLSIELATSKDKFEFYKGRIKELNKILNSNLATRFQYAKEISGEANLREILEIWLNYFRNIFIKNCSSATEPQRGEGGDEGKLRGRQTSSTSLEHLKNTLQQIQRIIFLISTTNINSRLALEILMMEL